MQVTLSIYLSFCLRLAHPARSLSVNPPPPNKVERRWIVDDAAR